MSEQGDDQPIQIGGELTQAKALDVVVRCHKCGAEEKRTLAAGQKIVITNQDERPSGLRDVEALEVTR